MFQYLQYFKILQILIKNENCDTIIDIIPIFHTKNNYTSVMNHTILYNFFRNTSYFECDCNLLCVHCSGNNKPS